jgi:hypothetical protein
LGNNWNWEKGILFQVIKYDECQNTGTKNKYVENNEKEKKEMMKKLSLLLVTFGLCVALSACGNSNETISDSEAATEKDIVTESDSEAATESYSSYAKDIDSYYSKDGDMENLVEKLDDDDIFEIGKNIIISNDEVAEYETFYENAGEDDALAKAQEYARERNALYAAAIENGFTVTDEDINNYLEDRKKEIKSIISDDEYQELCAKYGTEDDYWAFEFEVYKINLPIQNYAKSLESEYKDSNSSITDDLELDQMWTEEYEIIKQKLVEEQNFISPGTED